MVNTYVSICGALGLRFSDLVERCTILNSSLYWNAIVKECEGQLPSGFSSDAKSIKALKTLVFGGAAVAAWLLRVAHPGACAKRLSYPSESLKQDFVSLADEIEKKPLTMKQRIAFLQQLQTSPLAAMSSTLSFPTPQMIADQIARDEAKRKSEAGNWWPLEMSAQIDVYDEFEPWVESVRQKRELTHSETLSKVADVKPKLPSLLERLKKATAETGKKSELAEFLKAPLASVSRWLSGEREPGGEVALQMLHWVEQQERRK